jgi:hypothetical protein
MPLDNFDIHEIIDQHAGKTKYTNFRVDYSVNDFKIVESINWLTRNIDDHCWRITLWNNGAVVWSYSLWFFKKDHRDQFILWNKLVIGCNPKHPIIHG